MAPNRTHVEVETQPISKGRALVQHEGTVPAVLRAVAVAARFEDLEERWFMGAPQRAELHSGSLDRQRVRQGQMVHLRVDSRAPFRSALGKLAAHERTGCGFFLVELEQEVRAWFAKGAKSLGRCARHRGEDGCRRSRHPRSGRRRERKPCNPKSTSFRGRKGGPSSGFRSHTARRLGARAAKPTLGATAAPSGTRFPFHGGGTSAGCRAPGRGGPLPGSGSSVLGAGYSQGRAYCALAVAMLVLAPRGRFARNVKQGCRLWS